MWFLFKILRLLHLINLKSCANVLPKVFIFFLFRTLHVVPLFTESCFYLFCFRGSSSAHSSCLEIFFRVSKCSKTFSRKGLVDWNENLIHKVIPASYVVPLFAGSCFLFLYSTCNVVSFHQWHFLFLICYAKYRFRPVLHDKRLLPRLS